MFASSHASNLCILSPDFRACLVMKCATQKMKNKCWINDIPESISVLSFVTFNFVLSLIKYVSVRRNSNVVCHMFWLLFLNWKQKQARSNTTTSTWEGKRFFGRLLHLFILNILSILYIFLFLFSYHIINPIIFIYFFSF